MIIQFISSLFSSYVFSYVKVRFAVPDCSSHPGSLFGKMVYNYCLKLVFSMICELLWNDLPLISHRFELQLLYFKVTCSKMSLIDPKSDPINDEVTCFHRASFSIVITDPSPIGPIRLDPVRTRSSGSSINIYYLHLTAHCASWSFLFFENKNSLKIRLVNLGLFFGAGFWIWLVMRSDQMNELDQ